jgi:glycosyltransferase 2 family protein
VLERLFDTAATAVLAGASLLLFRGQLAGPAGGWDSRIRVAGGALLAGLVVFAAFLVYFRMHGAGFMERRLAGWRTVGGWRGFAATQLAGFSDGLQAIRGLSDCWAAIAYSVLHWGLIVLVYFWVMRSFGGALGQLSVRSAMLVLAITMMGSLVQLPGVGGGAQLASFIALTRIFQIAPEPAAAAAVLTWLITFAGSCLIGLPLLIHEGWSMGELRRLASAETQAEFAGGHTTVAEVEAIGQGREPRGGDGAQ